jgi:hypothetical protein
MVLKRVRSRHSASISQSMKHFRSERTVKLRRQEAARATIRHAIASRLFKTKRMISAVVCPVNVLPSVSSEFLAESCDGTNSALYRVAWTRIDSSIFPPVGRSQSGENNHRDVAFKKSEKVIQRSQHTCNWTQQHSLERNLW